jgi:anti-sigma factor RsiW
MALATSVLRMKRSGVTLSQSPTMNPDKLFDYLDDRLPAAERAALERQLISDRQLQRELAVARQIHAGMRGDSREVLLPTQTEADAAGRGRKMALRVGAVFILLMAVNVGVGLWMIARHGTKNPNRALLETQMRQQITKALEHAATTLPPVPSLGVGEITIPAATGKLDIVADEVVTIASQCSGSATKGLPDQHRLSVLVDLPSNRESEFRAAIASIAGGAPGSTIPATTGTPAPTTPATTEKKSFVVQIVEAPTK